MTCARTPGGIEDALFRALRDLSDNEIAQACEVDERSARRWSQENDPRRLPAHAAVALDRALLKKGLPAVIVPAMLRLVGAPQSAATVADIQHGLRRVVIEVGETTRVVDEAGADGRYERHELRAMLREIDDALRALWELRQSCLRKWRGIGEVAAGVVARVGKMVGR